MLDNPLLQYVTDAKGNIASVIILGPVAYRNPRSASCLRLKANRKRLPGLLALWPVLTN